MFPKAFYVQSMNLVSKTLKWNYNLKKPVFVCNYPLCWICWHKTISMPYSVYMYVITAAVGDDDGVGGGNMYIHMLLTNA